MRRLEHVVLIVAHPDFPVVTDIRVNIHVVLVDVAVLLAERAVPRHQVAVGLVLTSDEGSPLLVGRSSRATALLVAARAVEARERQVERAILLDRSHPGLGDVRTRSVLGLVILDDLLLCLGELLPGEIGVVLLPGVELPGDFVVNVRTNYLHIGSCTVNGVLVVLVSQRALRLVVLPPDHATRGAVDAALRPATVRCRVPLIVRGDRPLILRLSEPTLAVRPLLKDGLAVNDAVDTRGEVPALPFAGQPIVEATAVHVTTGDDRVLLRVGVLDPRTDLEVRVAGELELVLVSECILDRLRQVEDELTLGIRSGVVDRRDETLAVHPLQVDLDVRNESVATLRTVVNSLQLAITVHIHTTGVAPLLHLLAGGVDSRGLRATGALGAGGGRSVRARSLLCDCGRHDTGALRHNNRARDGQSGRRTGGDQDTDPTLEAQTLDSVTPRAPPPSENNL